jgi:hypothetical protein
MAKKINHAMFLTARFHAVISLSSQILSCQSTPGSLNDNNITAKIHNKFTNFLADKF